jgi:N4-gp56 family major capsid protein
MLNYIPGLPDGGVIDVGNTPNQLQPWVYLKKAIIRARKDQYFMPLASTINMPKHYGKTIKVYEYVPLLDDRNVNNQGLDANGATLTNGNLYGSSRDVGMITSKLPALTEDGGRVNRVGFTRLERQGSILKFGFFTEFTQESLDFDSDEGLMDHLATELMNGAVQLTEAVLQRDLLASVGVIMYSGGATSMNGTYGVSAETQTVGGVSVPPAVVNYKNLMRMDLILTNNRCPKQTTVITGSRMIDTAVIPAARILFVGGDLVPILKGMTDLFGNKAFISVQHYADAGTILNGEIGSIDNFRFIQVPEMLHYAGAGALVGTNPGYQSTTNGPVNPASTNYDVFPMLVLGDDSWTTIGFQTDGKSVKFTVLTKMPGKDNLTKLDPYGESGFSSIKWYYGILIKRPERMGVIYSVAPI